NDELKPACAGAVVDGAQYLSEKIQQQRVTEIDRVGVALEHDELRAAREIRDETASHAYATWRKQPPHVAPEKTPARRMGVFFAIGISVMVAMMSDPPQRSVLAGQHAEEGEHEPELLAGFERPVGEEAVITGGDAE